MNVGRRHFLELLGPGTLGVGTGAIFESHGTGILYVRQGRLDAVRVSTHIFNSEVHCDRAVEAIRAAVDNA